MNRLKRVAAACVSLLVVISFAGPSVAETVVDEIGRSVEIKGTPKRIVSLAPSITETLYALGLDEEIVGVSLFSDYPEQVRTKPKVGSFVNISIEDVVALNPDLIIGPATGKQKKANKVVAQLERFGLPVYITNPRDMEEIFKMILDLGGITGRRAAAERLVASLRERVDSVMSLVAKQREPRVFFQIGIDPIVSVGRDTFHDMLIRLAGGVNIAGVASVQYPRYNIEEIITERPDIIVVSSMKRGADFEAVRRYWQQWRLVPAVTAGRIHVIQTDITDHPSPRIVDGLEEMARIIHPEVFGAKKTLQ